MNQRKDIPLEQFTVHISPPSRQRDLLAVSILENGRLNLNGRLSKSLCGKMIDISFTEESKYLCISEIGEGDGWKVPKSGSMKSIGCMKILKDHNKKLPARYEVWYSEALGVWQGEYVENPLRKSSAGLQNTQKK
ncbi:MAG: hypothetical protein VB092_02945 [Oscillospiraceae bacterium]|nr:hypothetical protein [Oscillospiraceae bacterium]